MPLPEALPDFHDNDQQENDGSNGGIPARCAQHSTRLALLESSLADQVKHLCEIKDTLKQEFSKSNRRVTKLAKLFRSLQTGIAPKVNVLWYFVATVFAAGIVQILLGKFFK